MSENRRLAKESAVPVIRPAGPAGARLSTVSRRPDLWADPPAARSEPLLGPASPPDTPEADCPAKPQKAGANLRPVLRLLVPYGLALAMLWLLSTRLSALDLTDLHGALHSIAPLQWGLALLATLLSFWAVGRYDAVVHRQMGHRIAPHRSRRAGMAAIAVSQTVGLGLVTGALVRWRLLPDLSLWQASRLSLVVAMTFLAGWLVVTSVVVLVAPGLTASLRPIAGLVLALAVVAAGFCLWQPTVRLPDGMLPDRVAARLSCLAPPPLRTSLRIVALAALDTGAAAVAFYCVLPDMAGLSLALLAPAFLLALGAGLVSGSPGGIGPFEITLFALLPATPQAPLLAAILAFRLVYYALPALIGALVLVAGPGPTKAPRSGSRADPDPAAEIFSPQQKTMLTQARRAECRLALQTPLHLRLLDDTLWVLAETGQSLVSLGDPVAPSLPRRSALARQLARLRREALRQDRIAFHYKCSARLAAIARRAGYRVLAIASEAVIDPTRFDLASPRLAQVRRKLRKADKAGLQVRAAGAILPMDDMAALSDRWAAAHGGERGFSMGRFAPAHLADQQIFLAFLEGRLAGFMTFHVSRCEWALDLMRHDDTLPDGGMHALLAAAIRDAGARGLQRLSLAAVPRDPSGRYNRLCRVIDHATAASGLRQFKAAFAPSWEPLYVAAPSVLGLLVGGCDVARAIAFPSRLRTPQPPGQVLTAPSLTPGPAINMRHIHNHHDKYEFACRTCP